MSNTVQLFETQLKRIEEINKIDITRSQWHEYLGRKFSKIENTNAHRLARTISNLSKEEKDIAVTSRQLASIAVESMHPNHSEMFGWKNDHTTLWNVVNWGSEVLKMERGVDAATVLEVTDRWTQDVINAFSES